MPRVTPTPMTRPVLCQTTPTSMQKKTLQVSDDADNPKSTINIRTVTAAIAKNVTLTHAFCWQWQPRRRQNCSIVFARSRNRASACRRLIDGVVGEYWPVEGGALFPGRNCLFSVFATRLWEKSHCLTVRGEAGTPSGSFPFFLLYKRGLEGGVDSNDCSVKNFSRWGCFHGKEEERRKRSVFVHRIVLPTKMLHNERKTELILFFSLVICSAN